MWAHLSKRLWPLIKGGRLIVWSGVFLGPGVFLGIVAALSGCQGGGSASSSSRVVASSSPIAVSAGPSSVRASSAQVASSASAINANSATQYYVAQLDPSLIQAQCLICHNSTGIAKSTRLVFTTLATANAAALITYSQTLGLSQTLLRKVKGSDNHGGGVQLTESAEGYQKLVYWLSLLNGQSSSATSANAFQKMTLAPYAATLRRASLFMTGQFPTPQQLAAVTDEALYRSTLKALLQGPGFHEFIIRAANDRLLTDAFNNDLALDIFDPNSNFYPVLADSFVKANQTNQREQFYQTTYPAIRYGAALAPLELIAHVVESDKPYTEILTANYSLANPQLAAIYRADLTPFGGATAFNVFKPVNNRGQILRDDRLLAEFVEGLGTVITQHGDFVEYPHAGILSEPAFLNRYPSTDTNRNRARARWAYYHFLGVDIEKSAARTTDPIALADTNNPTLHNPACSSCHQRLDPVAGSFQNFGDEGQFRNSWGGRDALPSSYKNSMLYQSGDIWYRDMRLAGFEGKVAPDAKTSLSWLGKEMAADARFASATVAFWWPAIMAEPPLAAPENSEDSDYGAKLAAYNQQQLDIQALSSAFRQGIRGGKPYNLRDLFIEMTLSPWFRGQGTNGALSADESLQLQGLGLSRLLTPEELENKTLSLLGYAWGQSDAPWRIDNRYSNLRNRYVIYYGGIDSVGITSRARELNTLMSNVAQTQAIAMACGATVMDFNRHQPPKLFNHISRYITPVSHGVDAVTVATDSTTPTPSNVTANLPVGRHWIKVDFSNPHWDSTLQQGSQLVIRHIRLTDKNNTAIVDVPGENMPSLAGFSVTRNDDGNATGNRYYDASANRHTGYLLWSGGIEIPVDISQAGVYTLTVSAWQRQLPTKPATMVLSLNSGEPHSNTWGEQQIKSQLVALHQQFWGQTLTPESAEVAASFDLLVDAWQWRQQTLPRRAYDWKTEGCDIPIARWWEQDWTNEFADPGHMQGTWMAVLLYLMSDFQYLHE